MKIQSLNKIIFALLLYWTSVLSFFHLFHSFLVITQRRDFIGWFNEITRNHKKERMVGSEFDWRLSFFHSPTHLPLYLPLLQPLGHNILMLFLHFVKKSHSNPLLSMFLFLKGKSSIKLISSRSWSSKIFPLAH